MRWILSHKPFQAYRLVLVGKKFFSFGEVEISQFGEVEISLYGETEIFCVVRMIIDLIYTFANSAR